MTNSRFTIFKTKDGQHAFNLAAANGEVILTSERYTSRSAAENGVAAVRDNARQAPSSPHRNAIYGFQDSSTSR